MFELQIVDRKQAKGSLDGLVELFSDSIKGGASIGFLSSSSKQEIEDYWKAAIAEIASDTRILIIAVNKEGNIAGSAQLAFSPKPNARHRGEVQKVLVHSRYRRQGLGKKLMKFVEDTARLRNIKLLVLDTAIGEVAEQMYLKLNYIRIGEIPNYASLPDGRLHPTSIFYKQLDI